MIASLRRPHPLKNGNVSFSPILPAPRGPVHRTGRNWSGGQDRCALARVAERAKIVLLAAPQGRAGRPTSRHARLAVNAATTLCSLMLDTLRDPDAPWRAESEHRTSRPGGGGERSFAGP